MIDHLSIGVSDLAASAAYYDAVLAPLGMTRKLEFEEAIGYGERWPAFWIGAIEDGTPPPAGLHIALVAPRRTAVDAFHAAAVSSGGEDAGPPGLRPHYGPDYYAAFVRDPDGYKIEAVCHQPE